MEPAEPSALLFRVVAGATTGLLALTEQHAGALAALAAYVAAWLLLRPRPDRST